MNVNDRLNPVFVKEFEDLRTELWGACRTIERREWLYRYCCVVTGIEVPKPLFEPSTNAELLEVINLLKLVHENCFTEEEATDFLMEHLKKKYGHSWQATVTLGTDFRLVQGHHNVWDAGTDSLLPSAIGRFILADRHDHSAETNSRNMGYSYRSPNGHGRLDLYLYAASVPHLENGLSEDLARKAGETLRGTLDYAVSNGEEILEVGEWKTVEFTSPDEDTWPVATVEWTAKTSGGDDVVSAIFMTGFGGGVAKVRWTYPVSEVQAEDWPSQQAWVEADLANYFYTFR